MDETLANRATLAVNGERHELRCGADTPLTYVLRNDLGLVGTRFGCGVGLCGVCFVLLDGVPVPSCETPVWSADGHEVTTLEGLGELGERLRRAFVEEQAAQCGYCLSGMLVSAAALLRDKADVSEDDVRAALDRHLCRCGTHGRIVRAVVRAAATNDGAGTESP
jgi:nicotinate dehydrogenase subunit A